MWPRTAGILFVLIFSTINLSATDVLERLVTLQFQQTPLKEALARVATAGGFELSYNANILDASQRITLVTNNWTVRETLYEILGENYGFKSNGNYLILKKQHKPSKQIYGYIKDPKTGDPVVNATVYDKKSLRATTTDANGYYKLKVPQASQIAISRADYQDTVFSVSPNSPRFQKIELQAIADRNKPSFDFQKTMDEAMTRAEQFFQITYNKWTARNLQDSLHRRFQVSFLPKMGTNHHLSAFVVNDWSLNVLAGISRGNEYAEVAGLGNFTKENMRGVQIAGLFNEVRGSSNGVQIGGLYNRSADSLAGIQIAGLTNFTRNIKKNSVQISGVSNYAKHGTPMVQISGVVNKSADIDGVQIAGVVNITDTVDGVQIAGVFNRAKKVRGIQIGLVNSAKSVKGLQIGLINRSGRRVLPFINW